MMYFPDDDGVLRVNRGAAPMAHTQVLTYDDVLRTQDLADDDVLRVEDRLIIGEVVLVLDVGHSAVGKTLREARGIYEPRLFKAYRVPCRPSTKKPDRPDIDAWDAFHKE